MKKERQALIASIISENKVSTQEELLGLLVAMGINATQATVSRDIKDMGIVKRSDSLGGYKYVLPEQSAETNRGKYMAILTGSVLYTDIAMNTVVIKCSVGTAQAACAAIDSLELENIAGTLAGDDTIFMLAYTEEAAREVKKKIDDILGE
ncbi:MAG: ArgR family transcriptional regulator [Clostridia bacterium]|nr:ArgR family transcriptional regulator [Clostridia bacterium]